jgi:WD40 repeat protein
MSRSSGAATRWHSLACSRHFAALSIAIAICLTSTEVLAQRRPVRGGRSAAPASREAPGQDRYGGSAGYGTAGGGANAGAGSRGETQGPLTYPARTYDTSGGALAEFQKPSYDHHRFVLSPDGTRMALSGRHMGKDAAAKGDAPAKVKRDASGKPIVIANILEVVDVASGRSVVSFKPPMLFDNLALSPDNQFLAAETSQRAGIVNVLHLPSRKSKELKTGQRRIPPGGIVFSSDSRSVNIILPDRLLTIAIGSGEIKEFKYESASPAVSFSPTTNMLAVGVSRSRRGRPEVQIYDVAQRKPLEELAVPAGPNRVEFSTDGRYLAATIAGGVVRLWQTSDWTSVGSVAGQFAFDPGLLAVSADGQLVAVRSRGTGSQELKVINITGGDTVQSIRTSEMSFLPSGLLAVADGTGPFYLNTSSGSLTELPGGDAALAQSGDSQLQAGDAAMQSRYATPPPGQTGYGQAPAPQQNPQVGYGQAGAGQDTTLPPEYASRYGQSQQQPAGGQAGNGQPGSDQGTLPPEYASRYSQSPQQPQNGQPGYGQVPPQPPSDQPGYGQVPTAQPPNDQPGYGQVPSQPPTEQAGYGRVATPQPPSDQPGYGQVPPSQPPSDQLGYGQVTPQPSNQPGYGQANTTTNDPSSYGQVANAPASQPGYGVVSPQSINAATGTADVGPSAADASQMALPERRSGQWLSLESENLQAPPTDEPAKTFWQLTQDSVQVAISGDGTKLVRIRTRMGSGRAGDVDWFDLKTGSRLFGSAAVVDRIAWSQNGEYLITRWNKGGRFEFHHLPTKNYSRHMLTVGDQPSGLLAISNDGNSIYSQYQSSLIVTNRNKASEADARSIVVGANHTLVRLPPTTTAMAFWPERNQAVCTFPSSSGKGTLAILAPPNSTPIQTVDVPAPATTISYSPDGKHVALGLTNGQIHVFTTSDWKEVAGFDGGDKRGYRNIAISSGARFVAAHSADETDGGLLIWRVSDGRKYPKSLFSTSHAFLPNGTLVKASGAGTPVLFHDFQSNRDVWPWEAGSLSAQASTTPAPGVALDQAAEPAVAATGNVAPPQPQSSSSYGR